MVASRCFRFGTTLQKAVAVASSVAVVLVFVGLGAWPYRTNHALLYRRVVNAIDAMEIVQDPRRLLANSSQGSACEAIQAELHPCNSRNCENAKFNASCSWADWSEWGLCDCGGIQKRRRTGIPGRLGSVPCNGPVEVLQPCTPVACKGNHAVDCMFAPWSPWSDCTRSCQGGQQDHFREVVRQQQGMGVFCSGPLHATRVCNVQMCPGSTPIDCRWGNWAPWSSCSVSCGFGEKERSREVVVAPKNGGKLCEPVTNAESAKCGHPCKDSAVDCLWNVWAPWSACSATCGQGQRVRSRHIVRQSKAGGVGCHGYLEDFQNCILTHCSLGGQDCSFGVWSDWSDCSAPCNGHHSHTRTIAKINQDNGLPCQGPATEVKPCNIGLAFCKASPIDCEYSAWEAWSSCSRSCGGGMTERKRTVAVHAQGNGGAPCSGDMETVMPCNVHQCPGKLSVDCKWAGWSEWSACTLTCGGGEQRRHRSIILEASNGGRPCEGGNAIEVGPCKVEPCVEHEMVCEWASWGLWSICERSGMSVTCGGGQKKRTRVTHLVNRIVQMDMQRRLQGWQNLHSPSTECKNMQDMVEPCAEDQCDVLPPSNCTWGIWSDWSPCPCNGVSERHRVIDQMAIGAGMPCEGSEVQAKMCAPQCRHKAALDCHYSIWSGWSACNVPCGAGNSTRFRTVVQYPQGGGRPCMDGDNYQRQQNGCNNIPCPVKQDCKWGDWSVYSACSLTCGGGEKSRARQVVQIGKNGGQPCDKKASSEVVACGAKACPSNAHDCEFSLWNPWQPCSQTCGRGTQYRDRVIMIDATKDGKPCKGQLQDYRECSLAFCATEPQVDCLWGVWSVWSACTGLCNGHRERSRAIERFAEKGGNMCEGTERNIKSCNVDSPVCKEEGPRDCVLGSWQMWTSCSKRCDGGQHYRTREVNIPARNFGKPCEGSLQQTQLCNADPCPGKTSVNCIWGDWQHWSACSTSCDGGQKVRHRGIAVEAKNGGLPCPIQAAMELLPCNTKTCTDAMEVCGWSQWYDWEECSQTCGGGQQQHLRLRQWLPAGVKSKQTRSGDLVVESGPLGISTPQRRLSAIQSLEGPDDCTGSQKEIRPCGLGACNIGGPAPLPCRWASWSVWSACSCDGIQERSRRVAERAKNGGLVCIGPLRETKGCNPQCDTKSVDCSFSKWTTWSTCSASCGGGQRYHSRALQTHSRKFGSGCHGHLEEVQACNSFRCEATVDCKYGDWAVWSTCSRSCGGGQKSRARDVKQYPKGDGKPCEDEILMEVAGCGSQSCTPWSATDCKWSLWSSWGACSSSCGDGRRFRTRNVAVVATHLGKPCSGLYEEYRNCRLPRCGEKPADCTFSLWSVWTQCTETCSGHQERTRHLKSFALGDGGNPCQGALRQVRACDNPGSKQCEGHLANVDCTLGDWSTWSACTRSCGSGQRFTHRHVTQQASGLGKPCDDTLQITEACHTSPCSGSLVLDCLWGDWGPFSACSVTCGGGQMHRHRSIRKEQQNGGRPCAEGDTVQLRPCSAGQCSREQCTWSIWSAWQDCSASCGPGEKKRQRELRPNVRSSYRDMNLSNLDAVFSHKVGSQPDDPITELASKHDVEILSLAIIGAISLVCIAGHWVCAPWPSPASCITHWRTRNGMSTSNAVYMPVSTEESEDCLS